jgi:hypothetical protein
VVQTERLGNGDQVDVARGAACRLRGFGNPPPDFGETVGDV